MLRQRYRLVVMHRIIFVNALCHEMASVPFKNGIIKIAGAFLLAFMYLSIDEPY